MTSYNFCVWGNSRWSQNYISALLEIYAANIDHIFLLSSSIELPSAYHGLPVVLVPSSDLCAIKACLNLSTHSFVVNKNIDHSFAVDLSFEYNNSILCEKPLLLPVQLLSDLEKYCSTNLHYRFWESMLPLYCSYFNQLSQLISFCSSIHLFWHDTPTSMLSSSSFTKRHDPTINYITDIIPHTMSIIQACGLSLSSPTIYAHQDLRDSAIFSLSLPSTRFMVHCSRIHCSRLRLIHGYLNEELIFSFNFTHEPGTLLLRRSIPLLHNTCKSVNTIQSKHSRPIKLQILDFLDMQPFPSQSRSNYSCHSYHLHHT